MRGDETEYLTMKKVVVIRVICRFSDFSNLYMNTDGGGTLSFTIALIPVFVRYNIFFYSILLYYLFIVLFIDICYISYFFIFLFEILMYINRAFYGRIFYLNVPTLSNLAWNAILVEVFGMNLKIRSERRGGCG